MRRSIVTILISLLPLPLAGFSAATFVTVAQLSFDWSFAGSQQGAELGAAVSGVGDVNGDGYADVIIGAPKFDAETYKGGAVFGFYGSPGGPGLAPDWTVGSDQKGSRFGGAVSGAGDVNGDGFDDVLIGAYRANNGETEEGQAALFYGSRYGLAAAPAWSFESNQIEAQLGHAVSGAGDVNGDGFADVVVGARWWDSDNLLNAGAAYIFYGSPAGLPAAPNRIITGAQAGAGLGWAVSGAGDVNGDGFADVLIGAPMFDTGGETEGGPAADAGAVFLYLGSAQGVAEAPAWAGFGPHPGAELGAAVSGAGDVNGDGFADVLIGAPHLSHTVDDAGAVYLYRGAAAGLPATPDRVVYGQQSGSQFGAAVSSAGDFNRDGLAEFIAGAPYYTGDQSHEGAVFVYSSGAFTWLGEGNKADTQLGAAVAPAGDVNGDGCADIIIGAPLFRLETDLQGRVFVSLGKLVSLEAGPVIYLPLVIKAGM